MFAIKGKREPQKISLPSIAVKPILGKVRKLVGFEIQNRERLFEIVGIGSESAVQKDDEAAVGRYRPGRGQIIDLARVTGNLREQAAVRQLYGTGGLLSDKIHRGDEKDCRNPRQKSQTIVFRHRKSLHASHEEMMNRRPARCLDCCTMTIGGNGSRRNAEEEKAVRQRN